MAKIDSSKLGLTLGIFAVIVHLLLSIIVAAGAGQTFVNFILGMHFLSLGVTVAQFSFGTAAALLIIAFVVGYIVGYVFGAIWNSVNKK